MPKHWEGWHITPHERPPNLGRLEVARGPEAGHWLVRAYVPDRQIAEAVLRRWRREFPGQVVCILSDGEPVEDEQALLARLRRERAAREAAYFERLADEAGAEGKLVDETRYRVFAARFRNVPSGENR